MPGQVYDYAVIGAGYAGITAAALLAKQGYRTVVLESHTELGGCASNFLRRNDLGEFSFDVGATTISGFDQPKPLGTLFQRLGLKQEAQAQLKRLDIGMKVFYRDEVITRYSNQEAWLEENDRVFADQKIIRLWKKIFKDEKLAWSLLAANEGLFPLTLSSIVSKVLAKPQNYLLNLQAIKFLPYLFQPFTKLLSDFDIDNQAFIDFVREQLLITTQSTEEHAPILSAIMGLNYPQEVYYPRGSIKNLGLLLKQNFEDNSGQIFFKQELENIEKEAGCYKLTTNLAKAKRSGLAENEFYAKKIISNAPIWNLQNLLPVGASKTKIQQYSQEHPEAWSAFTVYFAAKLNLDLETNYLQIHSDNGIRNCQSESIFVTVSEPGDRAPDGWLTFTISTHTKPDFWFQAYAKSKKAYEEEKLKTQDEILDLLFSKVPELRHAEKEFIASGTAKSFEFFTKRAKGFVGGIAHDYRKPLLFMPQSKFAKEDIYLVGDSSFPGQGIAAVAYSAMNLIS